VDSFQLYLSVFNLSYGVQKICFVDSICPTVLKRFVWWICFGTFFSKLLDLFRFGRIHVPVLQPYFIFFEPDMLAKLKAIFCLITYTKVYFEYDLLSNFETIFCLYILMKGLLTKIKNKHISSS
jgi:hypothetical protein